MAPFLHDASPVMTATSTLTETDDNPVWVRFGQLGDSSNT